MTGSGNLISNVVIAANGTSVGSVTGSGASRSSHNSVVAVTGSGNLISNVVIAANGTSVGSVTDSGTSGSGHNSVVTVTKGLSLVGGEFMAAVRANQGAVTAIGTSRIDHNSTSLKPAITGGTVIELCTRLSTGSFQIGAVTILQPCGGNVHIVIYGTGSVQTERHFLNACAIIHDNLTGLLAGGNRSTTADGQEVLINSYSRVQITIANNGTIHIKDHVLQRRCRTLNTAGGRRIGCCNQFGTGEYILAPVLQIVQVHIVSTGAINGQVIQLIVSQGHMRNLQRGTLVNIDLNTRLKCNILLQNKSAGLCMNGHVAVQVQDVVRRVKLSTTDNQLQQGLIFCALHANVDASNRCITVGSNHQTIRAGIIVLHNITIGRNEHTIRSDKLDRRRDHILTANCHRSKCILPCAGVNGQSDLNILNIVLREEEILDVIIGRIAIAVSISVLLGINKYRQVTAAREVAYLHRLVHIGSGIGEDLTVAVDITPNIQIRAVVHNDLRIRVHIDCAVGTSHTSAIGALTGSALHGGQYCLAFQIAVDIDDSTISQRQCQISSRRNNIRGHIRRITHRSILIIAGDQQRCAGGNGIVVCGDSTTGSQSDQRMTPGCCVTQSLLKAIDISTANIEYRRSRGHNNRLNSTGSVKVACVCSTSRKILTRCYIVPAKNLVSGSRGGSKSKCSGSGLFQSHGGRTGRNRGALRVIGHSIAAICRSLKCRSNVAGNNLNKADIRNLCSQVIPGAVAACGQHNLNGGTSFQFGFEMSEGRHSGGVFRATNGDTTSAEITG